MPITRRRALQSIATSTLGMLTAACGMAPSIGSTRALTVWTMHYIADDVLARWRRMHPAQPLTRVPVAPQAMASRLQAAFAGAEAIPDVIVADTDILAHFSAPGSLHPLNELSLKLDALASAGVAQCQSEDNRLLALPLAVNPLGVWYRSDLLHRAGLPQQPDNVQALLGDSWQTFFTTGVAIRAALPDVAWVADALSDVFEPLSRTALPLVAGAQLTFAVRQQRVDSAVARESGAWFDQIQRDSVAMVVAGSWMQSILARTTRPEEFPWRLVPTPGGCIAGASMAVAVTETSSVRDAALQFAQDIVFDAEMQLALSDSGHVIPALTSTYQDGRFQRMESFCAGQKVGQIWTQAAQIMRGEALSARGEQRRQDANLIVISALNGTLTYETAVSQLAQL